MEGGGGVAWTDEVEDLVDRGDVDGAISVLEAVVARLEADEVRSSSSTPTPPPPPPCPGDLRLAAALGDLAELHASRGFSLKADELRSRALALRARADRAPPANLGLVRRPRLDIPLGIKVMVWDIACLIRFWSWMKGL